MNATLADLARRAARAWVAFVCRFALVVAVAALALTALAGVYFVHNLRINTDTSEMIDPELPFRKLTREVGRAFPQFSDNILVVVEGATPDLADDAALALGLRLRAKPELFGPVIDQGGDPFFRRNGLLFKSVEDLGDLSDRLARAQPFLGALWKDPSLRGLVAMLNLALDESLKGAEGEPMELAPALAAMADVVAAQREGRFKPLSWQEVMSGETAAPKDKRRLLLIQPALDHASLAPAAEAIGEIRRLAQAMGLAPEHGVRVRLTGSAALNHEELQTVQSSVGLAAAVSLLVVAAIVFGGLRSLRLGVAIIGTLVMGLTWTAAIGIALFGELNLLSITFVILFVGLSDDFGIHFCLRYEERLAEGEERGRALAHGGADVGRALFLCALATAAGFFAFVPTDYRGLAQLGAIAGIGMFVALFANMTVMPALLMTMGTRARPSEKRSARAGESPRASNDAPLSGRAGESPRALNDAPLSGRAGRPSRWTVRFWDWVLRRRHPLAAALAAATLVAAVAASHATFDFEPLNLKDPRAESVVTLRALQGDAKGGGYIATVLAKDLAEAEALAERLGTLPEVDETRTLRNFIPERQREKLELIADMALFLAPALTSEKRTDPPAAAEVRAGLAAMADRLERLARMGENEAAEPAGRLARLTREHVLAGPAEAAGERWRDLEHLLLAALPGRLAALKDALEARPVALADIPEEFRRQYIAPDGRARIEIVPRDDLRDPGALARFVAAIRTVAPAATGSPVVLYESVRTVVSAFAEATALATILVVLLLYGVLRDLGDVALTLLPTFVAALMTGAVSVAFDVPFNYANVIVLPLLFGLSVNSGIHLVVRTREGGDLKAALASSTPRAMIVSATTTITSFASLAFADHWGMASLGIMLTVAMVLTLGSALIALPVALALCKNPGRAGESPRALK